jgi:hypothetical protein
VGPVVSLDRFIAETLPGLPPRSVASGDANSSSIWPMLFVACTKAALFIVIFIGGTSFSSRGELDAFYLIDAHASRRQRNCLSWPERAADLAALDAPAPWFFNRPTGCVSTSLCPPPASLRIAARGDQGHSAPGGSDPESATQPRPRLRG